MDRLSVWQDLVPLLVELPYEFSEHLLEHAVKTLDHTMFWGMVR